jgi:hypothetical protein
MMQGREAVCVDPSKTARKPHVAQASRVLFALEFSES